MAVGAGIGLRLHLISRSCSGSPPRPNKHSFPQGSMNCYKTFLRGMKCWLIYRMGTFSYFRPKTHSNYLCVTPFMYIEYVVSNPGIDRRQAWSFPSLSFPTAVPMTSIGCSHRSRVIHHRVEGYILESWRWKTALKCRWQALTWRYSTECRKTFKHIISSKSGWFQCLLVS